MEEFIINYVLIIIGFLSLAVASSILLKKINFPYTIGLVIIGGAIGFITMYTPYLSGIRDLVLTPDIILYVILPTLVFDAAINIDFSILRKNIVPIVLLAVVGVAISAVICGVGIGHFTILSISGAFLFGALISATDPVAVIALFNELGAPKRLVTLIDGESIFNDATAIVLFTIFLSAIQSNLDFSTSLILTSVFKFFIVLFGGVIIGIIVGYLGSLVVKFQKNSVILQVTISLVMAYVSFIIANHFLDVSGVMSTLAAGITIKYLSNDTIKEETSHYVENFWNYFSFVANSIVFTLLGMSEIHSFSNIKVFKNSIYPLIVSIIVISIGRVAVVYLLIPIYNKFSKEGIIPKSFQHIIFWGGLRGAVPVSLVLAIPQNFPHKDMIIHLTFGYILFTLLVQGTTIKFIMNHLGIKPDKSFFDYHNGIDTKFNFPSHNLAELVLLQVINTLTAEGFFYEGDEDDSKIYFLKRGTSGVLFELNGIDLIMTTLPTEIRYGKQVVYETLLELNQSVSTLKEFIKPDRMQEIVNANKNKEKSKKSYLKQFIDISLITNKLKSTTKDDVIKELINIARKEIGENYTQRVYDKVMERENSMTTCLGDGIAIPHAKCDIVNKPIVIIGIKKDGLDFESLDSKPAQIFFLLISQKSVQGPHIQILAEIAKIVSKEEMREKLINAPDVNTIYNILVSKN